MKNYVTGCITINFILCRVVGIVFWNQEDGS